MSTATEFFFFRVKYTNHATYAVQVKAESLARAKECLVALPEVVYAEPVDWDDIPEDMQKNLTVHMAC